MRSSSLYGTRPAIPRALWCDDRKDRRGGIGSYVQRRGGTHTRTESATLGTGLRGRRRRPWFDDAPRRRAVGGRDGRGADRAARVAAGGGLEGHGGGWRRFERAARHVFRGYG